MSGLDMGLQYALMQIWGRLNQEQREGLVRCSVDDVTRWLTSSRRYSHVIKPDD